jgi:cytoskeletal protein CcmA (bactofilin family)
MSISVLSNSIIPIIQPPNQTLYLIETFGFYDQVNINSNTFFNEYVVFMKGVYMSGGLHIGSDFLVDGNTLFQGSVTANQNLNVLDTLNVFGGLNSYGISSFFNDVLIQTQTTVIDSNVFLPNTVFIDGMLLSNYIYQEANVGWVRSSNNIFYNIGNVGINTDNPLFTLDVDGNIHGNNLFINDNIYLQGNLLDLRWQANGSSIYYNLGNVGIGTDNPQYPLEVNGNIQGGNVNVTGNFYINGALLENKWLSNGTSVYYLGGNIGIGTNNPTQLLQVVGNSNIASTIEIKQLNPFSLSQFKLGYDDAFSSSSLQQYGPFYSTNIASPNDLVLQNNFGNVRILSQSGKGITVSTSTGHIGINNRTPSGNLDINTSYISPNIQLKNIVFGRNQLTPNEPNVAILSNTFVNNSSIVFRLNDDYTYNSNYKILWTNSNFSNAVSWTPIGMESYGTYIPNYYFNLGNIAIGYTNDPQQPIEQKLTVRGSNINDKEREISIGGNYIILNQNERIGAVTFYSNNNSIELARIEATLNTNTGFDNNSDLRFFVRNDYGNVNYIEAMRIDPYGNIGIGTTTPRSNLDVNGNIWANNLILSESLYINGNIDIDGNININSSVDIVGNLTVGNIALFVNSTSNQVGINTNQPTSNLHVIGTANITGNTEFGSNVTFLGNVVFQSNLTVQDNIYIDKNITIYDSANLLGNIQIGSTSNLIDIPRVRITDDQERPTITLQNTNINGITDIQIYNHQDEMTTQINFDNTTNIFSIFVNPTDAILHLESQYQMEQYSNHILLDVETIGGPEGKIEMFGNVQIAAGLYCDAIDTRIYAGDAIDGMYGKFNVKGDGIYTNSETDIHTIQIEGSTGITEEILISIDADTTNLVGSLQTNEKTIGPRPFLINPFGGNVGINTVSVTPSILQVGDSNTDVIGPITPLDNTITIFGKATGYPSVNGNTFLGGTMYIGSTDEGNQNIGASISLGGKLETANIQQTFARISGVKSIPYYLPNLSDGSFVIETANLNGVMNERMRIDGEGRVGIGLDNPQYTVDVNGNINVSGNIFVNNSPIISLWQQNGNDIYYNQGYVGIGTTTPTANLTVDGGVTISNGSFIVDDSNQFFVIATNAKKIGIGNNAPLQNLLNITNDTNYPTITLQNANDSYQSYIDFIDNGLIQRAQMGWKYQNVVSHPSELYLYSTNNIAIEYLDRFMVRNAADNVGICVDGLYNYVGINTINPQTELDVNGRIQTSNLYVTGTTELNGECYMYSNVIVSGNILPSTNITYDLGSNIQRFKDLYLSGTSIYLGSTVLTSNADGNLLVNGTPVGGTSQWISSGSNIYYNLGNVGIGTTQPLAKLHVNDNTTLFGTTTKWASYRQQTFGSSNQLMLPVTSGLINGINIPALNKRTRTSYASTINCVSTWRTRTSPEDNNWTSICWAPELGLFCAISSTGGTTHMMTSSNGITWTLQYGTMIKRLWTSICWSPELSLFCAVSEGGISGPIQVMTSPNGITWTLRTCASGNAWQSICWAAELGLFCAVAASGTGTRVMTSPDGINWTSQVNPVDNSWTSICWAPELSLFCAVSSDGVGNRVMTSSNGITWTSRTSAADNSWKSVCWSPELGLFCAVADSGTGNRVMTSPDGITWTTRTNSIDNAWNSVCWAPEISVFCAVAGSGTLTRVMTSLDGINWTTRTNSIDNTWNSVCWSAELSMFCAVSGGSGSGTRVMTSNIGMPNAKSTLLTNPSYMTVNQQNGNVGIGTSTPNYTLDVNGSINYTGTLYQNGTSFTGSQWTTSGTNIYYNNGSVGIGTSTPFYPLDIRKDNEYSTTLGISNPNISSTATTGIILQSDSSSGSTYIIKKSSNWPSGQANSLSIVNSSGNLDFYVGGQYTDQYRRMIITRNGNVGIGSTTPSAKLYVNHTGTGDVVRIEDETQPDTTSFVINDTGCVGVGINAPAYKVDIQSDSGVYPLAFTSTSTSASYSLMEIKTGIYNSTTTRSNALWQFGLQTLTNGTSNVNDGIFIGRAGISSADLRVNRDGNVGIGTVTPSAKFHVNHTGTGDVVRFEDSTQPDTSPFVINQDGNVGIGTTAPTGKLHVFDSLQFSPRIILSGQEFFAPSNTSTDGIALLIGVNRTNNRQLWISDSANLGQSTSNIVIRFLPNNIAGIGTIDAVATDGATVKNLCFNPNGGNIGIGTQTPSYTLDINGNINYTGTLYQNGTPFTGSQWTTSGSNIYYNSGSVGIGLTTFSSSLLPVFEVKMGNTAGSLVFNGSSTVNRITSVASDGSSALPLAFYGDRTALGPGIYLDINNNIGFGTSTPNGNLDIKGDTILFGTTTKWASYRQQTFGSSNILLLPVASGLINGINVPALNKRTRTSYASANNCVSTWTTRTNSIDNTWNSICWAPELSLFCAVAGSGTLTRVMTSPDGINWTTRTNSIDNTWQSVCWAAELGLFCVVGISGTGTRVMTSSNGITWATRTSAADNQWYSVCWAAELGLFCAVGGGPGTGNRVMKSSDGITWTTSTSASDVTWAEICWASELSLFCAVGPNAIMTSPDGIIWTSRTSPVNNFWSSVCWSPELGLFCAVSITGTANRIMTSPDGITWTTRTNPAENSWNSVCWAPELSLFCAVASSGTLTRVMTSPDGINWITRTNSIDNSWNSVCWSPELSIFCAVAGSGTLTRVMTSNIGMPNAKSTLLTNPSYMTVNQQNGNVGMGTSTPNTQLQLSTDGARKLTTTTWLTGSDIRVKKQIESANLDRCYDIIKDIDLIYFEWDQTYIKSDDKHSIGYKAQQVKEIYPNAVKTFNETFKIGEKEITTIDPITGNTTIVKEDITETIEDFHVLNTDQIVKSMHGAMKKLMEKVEYLEEKNKELELKIQSLL